MTLEDLTKLIVSKLKEIQNVEVTLQNPTTESKFPCKVVRTPLENILMTNEGTTVKARYSITIEEWANKKYDCMSMSNTTQTKLKELNITKVSNDVDLYDNITNKYRLITNYEVNYNGIYNSLELVK